MKVCITGGTGFIGSHIAVELLNAKHDVVLIDNFQNSKPKVLNGIQKITGRYFKFYQFDVREKEHITQILEDEKPDIVIHLAGLKSVGESMIGPQYYYDYNLSLLTNLIISMQTANCKKIIFSSTATVYFPDGNIEEDSFVKPTNTYANTKRLQELILEDFSERYNWDVTILRYFNPIGAHPSGLIGEDPSNVPTNLVPILNEVALGKRKELEIFGRDYFTPDGTCVRDYIHVMDLANAHVKAIENLKGLKYYNIGLGKRNLCVKPR